MTDNSLEKTYPSDQKKQKMTQFSQIQEKIEKQQFDEAITQVLNLSSKRRLSKIYDTELNVNDLFQICLVSKKIIEQKDKFYHLFQNDQLALAYYGFSEILNWLKKNNSKHGLNRTNLNEISRIYEKIVILVKEKNKQMESEYNQIIQLNLPDQLSEALERLNNLYHEVNKFNHQNLLSQIKKYQDQLENINKLFKMFKISNKLKIEDVAKFLNIKQAEFLELIIELNEKLKIIKIEDPYLVTVNRIKAEKFSSILDAQFKAWRENKEKNINKLI